MPFFGKNIFAPMPVPSQDREICKMRVKPYFAVSLDI